MGSTVSASQMNSLRTKLRNKLAERGNPLQKINGYTISQLANNFNYPTTPTNDSTILATQGNALISLILTINDRHGLKTVTQGDYIPPGFTNDRIETFINDLYQDTSNDNEIILYENDCRGGCIGCCTYDCYGGCDNDCESVGNDILEISCSSSSCYGSCFSSCADNCSHACRTGCRSGCKDGCSNACSDGCGSNCKNGCYGSCQNQCTSLNTSWQ